MPEHPLREPVGGTPSGWTLVELVIGVAIVGTISLVIAGLFQAGVRTYQYSMNQFIVLSRSRKALAGSGHLPGMISALREARGLLELAAERLVLESREGRTVRYYVSESGLYQEEVLTPLKLSDGVRELEVRYYALDETGRLVRAASPAEASLAATLLKLPGCGRQDCVFLSGAAPRNVGAQAP